MRLLIMLGLLSQFSITTVYALDENFANSEKQFVDVTTKNSSDSKPGKRFLFNTKTVTKTGNWQESKLTANLYKENGDLKISLKDFPIVGMKKMDIQKKIGTPVETPKESNLESGDTFRASPSMRCAFSPVYLQLKYKNDHVMAYRFFSIGLK
ncbi:MAG: hypothetical protein C0464_01410 [Cyanobacteria bacterium DS2.008]|nr:hypothetical protein [Cyanobacteria bacterium DS2.008]